MTLEHVHRPIGVFRKRNFMTPEIVGYYRTVHQGRTAYVELSRGRGMAGEALYGVTVRDVTGGRFEPDPSDCYLSRYQADRAIRALAGDGEGSVAVPAPL